MIAQFHVLRLDLIIACDEEAWRRVEKHRVRHSLWRMVGGTDRATGFTYIRGYAITHPFDSSPDSQPNHIITSWDTLGRPPAMKRRLKESQELLAHPSWRGFPRP